MAGDITITDLQKLYKPVDIKVFLLIDIRSQEFLIFLTLAWYIAATSPKCLHANELKLFLEIHLQNYHHLLIQISKQF